MTERTQPSYTNPASAQPIKGLSKRAQEMCKPKDYGRQIVIPRSTGEIPQAFRGAKSK